MRDVHTLCLNIKSAFFTTAETIQDNVVLLGTKAVPALVDDLSINNHGHPQNSAII